MMSKNRALASPGSGSGSLHGDVSFIRATSASNQSVDKMSAHVNQNPTHMPRIPPDLSLQPHLYHPHHHHRQQSQQHANSQPYVPEHKDSQQHVLKQPHGGAGGASGDAATISRTPSHTGVEGWSEREETLAAELEEAKIRVAQMEKTMRWWSDCTSNWREKWNKARNERNKAREENRLLRAKLESVAKEFSRLKREKNEASTDPETPAHGEYLLSPASSINKSHDDFDHSDKVKTVSLMGHDKDDCFDDMSETSSISKPPADHGDYKDVDDASTVGDRSHSGERTLISELSEKLANLQEKHTLLKEEMIQVQSKCAQTQDNLVVMQRKLDEANNTIQLERLENCNHVKIAERLQKELKEAHSKLEESNMHKQELKAEQNVDCESSLDWMDRNKKLHQDELSRLAIDLEDEAVSRTSLDKQITELRRELERIQAENASEWAKRERLESDKLALERDNKKLRTQVADLEEELEKKSHTSSSLVDSDIKTLQFELCEKNKELADLQHIHGKLKKALAERTTELDHHRRRAEQYETEVRTLRSRVDKLKHDLAAVEDEVDKQRNAARKAQRTSEELQTQVESLDVQVRHLQSRLRRNNSKHGSVTSPRSTSLKSLTLEDSAELADSETDFDDV